MAWRWKPSNWGKEETWRPGPGSGVMLGSWVVGQLCSEATFGELGSWTVVLVGVSWIVERWGSWAVVQLGDSGTGAAVGSWAVARMGSSWAVGKHDLLKDLVPGWGPQRR